MNQLIRYTLLSSMFLLIGCENSPPPSENSGKEENIRGRGTEGRKIGIYTINIPRDWIRRDPLPDDLITDTTKELCEFIINDPDGIIRITIHNFPADSLDKRIPPQAQVARWKNQLEEYDDLSSNTTPIAFGGYNGLLFIGVGKTMVIAAALQLHPEHFRNLPVTDTSRKSALFEQMRSDITIKAFGPITSIKKHQDDIIKSIHSITLVDEIPHPR